MAASGRERMAVFLIAQAAVAAMLGWATSALVGWDGRLVAAAVFVAGLAVMVPLRILAAQEVATGEVDDPS